MENLAQVERLKAELLIAKEKLFLTPYSLLAARLLQSWLRG